MQLTIEQWVERINEQEMPLLAGTARRLQAVCADDAAGLGDVSEVILADAAMTTRVLKLANASIYHGAAKLPVTTVSRAAVVLGVQTIAHMCLSMRILDDFLSHSQQQPLLRVLALGLRTAVLSRHLWQIVQPRYAEEVFIAGLLHDLGAAAYFSLGDASTQDLLALEAAGQDREQCAHKVLGIGFVALGRALAQSWGLGTLVGEVIGGSALSPQARLVGLCHRWAELGDGQDQSLADEMARTLGLSRQDVEAALHQALASLPEVCRDMGVEILLSPLQQSTAAPLLTTDAGRPLRRAQDAALQLGILREMATLEPSPAHFNALLAMMMEGLYRGVGLDRVLVAVLSPDGRMLSARTAVGLYDPLWRDGFRFDLKAGEIPLFRDILKRKQALWLGSEEACNAASLGPGAERLLGTQAALQAFVAPLLLTGRAIGLVYADCPHAPLQAEDFAAFKYFILQLQQSLFTARPGGA